MLENDDLGIETSNFTINSRIINMLIKAADIHLFILKYLSQTQDNRLSEISLVTDETLCKIETDYDSYSRCHPSPTPSDTTTKPPCQQRMHEI